MGKMEGGGDEQGGTTTRRRERTSNDNQQGDEQQRQSTRWKVERGTADNDTRGWNDDDGEDTASMLSDDATT